MLLYDLRCGILKRLTWIMLPVVFFSIVLAAVTSPLERNYKLSLGLYIFDMLFGSAPVDIQNKQFEIPYMWVLLELGSVLFTIEYPVRDMSLFGRQIMVRCGSRIKWWLSKCLWCFLSVAVYWGTGLIMTAIMCSFKHGSITLRLNANIVGALTDISLIKSILVLLVIPFFASLALNYIQMFLALFVGEYISISASVFIIVWSMCIKTPLAFMNYAMIERCSLFNEVGLNWNIGLIWLMAVIMEVIIFGGIFMKKADILEPKRNGD